MGQIGVFMTILEIVSPQNTEPSLFRNRVHDHTGQIFFPGSPKIFLLLSEIGPRLKHSQKRPPLPFQQKLEGSQPVQPKTTTHDRTQTFIRQILIKHIKVIPEIQIGLMRVFLGQRASPYMINHSRRHTDNAVSATA